MAVTIIEDLVKEAGGGWGTNGRWRRRVFYYEGLSPGPNIWSQAEAELQSQKSVSPLAPHPTDFDVVALTLEHKPFIDSKTQAKTIVMYGKPDSSGFAYAPRISFTATSREVMTSKERDGTIIVVQYIDPAGAQFVQTGRVLELKNNGILQIEQLETDIPVLALAAQGATNLDYWQGGAPGTWAMRAVEFTPAIFAVGYLVKYCVEYDEDGHSQVATFRNAFGYTPDDIDAITATSSRGNGWYRPEVGKVFNFNTLSLPPVFS